MARSTPRCVPSWGARTRRKGRYYLTVACTIFVPRTIAWVPRPGIVQQPHHDMYYCRTSSHSMRQAAAEQVGRMQSWLPYSTQDCEHYGVCRGMRRRSRQSDCNVLCQVLSASVANEAVEGLSEGAHTSTCSQHPPQEGSVSDSNSSRSKPIIEQTAERG